MNASYQDLVYALRALRRSPRLSMAAVLILVLGVGASATAFAIVSELLMPRVPFRDAFRLVEVTSTKAALTPLHYGSASSLADAAQVQAAKSVFAHVTYFLPRHTLVGGPFGVRQAEITYVPLDFFDIAGARPLLGHLPVPSKRETSPMRCAAISFDFWQAAFGGRLSVIGQEIKIDGGLYTVTAVVPQGMQRRYDIWLPTPHPATNADATLHRILIWAWLRKGVSLREAQAALNVIADRVATQYPKERGWKLIAVPYARLGVTSHQRATVFFLFGASVLVLLASCLNVGTLLLGRGLARSHEIGILAALGAPPGRVARQLILEGLVLGAAGGVLGLLAAGWFLKLVHPAVALWLPTLEGLPFSLDLKTCLFALGAAIVAGAICGVIPTLGLLRQNSASTTVGVASLVRTSPHHSHRLPQALVVVQVAAAMALLATSLLAVRSYQRLIHVNLGLRPDHVDQIDLYLSRVVFASKAQQLATVQHLLRVIRSLPGVQAAGAALTPVLTDNGFTGRVAVLQGAGEQQFNLKRIQLRLVTQGYFRTLGVKPIFGHVFDSDPGQTGPVVIVNQAFVRQDLQAREPVGARLYGGALKLRPLGPIIGVVPDMRERAATIPAKPTVYMSLSRFPMALRFIVLLARPMPGHSISPEELRGRVLAAEPETPVMFAERLGDALLSERAPLRLRSICLIALASLVTFLGLAGVYATTRLWTNQRASEFAVRAALGATPGDILRLSLLRNLGAALGGIVCGAALTLVIGRVTAAFLFRVTPYDPGSLVGSAAILLVTSLVASYSAARRSSRMSPCAALTSK